MKTNKILGLLLLVLATFTVVGMVLDNNDYWAVYNYITILITVPSGIVLLKQK